MASQRCFYTSLDHFGFPARFPLVKYYVFGVSCLILAQIIQWIGPLFELRWNVLQDALLPLNSQGVLKNLGRRKNQKCLRLTVFKAEKRFEEEVGAAGGPWKSQSFNAAILENIKKIRKVTGCKVLCAKCKEEQCPRTVEIRICVVRRSLESPHAPERGENSSKIVEGALF